MTAPTPLPREVQDAVEHPLAGVRAAAVAELERLLRGRHEGRALGARRALERLAHDDSRAVSAAAAGALSTITPRVAPSLAAPAPAAPTPRVTPSPAAPAPTGKQNRLAIGSMVISIVGLLGICVMGDWDGARRPVGVFGGILSLVGAILGHISQRQIRGRGEKGGGRAGLGIITGWIGFGISVVGSFST